jgi:uncharacterized BrkB/YihY/UPF0761 family membrane protein
MKIPGMQLIKKVERKGTEAEVPMAENLGLVDLCKLMSEEVGEDHVMAFAGNLTYKGLFPFFTFLLSLLGLFNSTDLVNTMLAVILLMLTAFGLVIFGSTVGGGLASVVGLGSVFQTVWSIVQWPILALVVLFAFALVYFFAPAARQKWRWISPGSVLAFVFWLVFSLLYSLYVGTFGSYNQTYGSLAGVIILMLYIYYSAVIMLVGAEINQVIESHIPGGKDEGEKVSREDRAPNVRRLRENE